MYVELGPHEDRMFKLMATSPKKPSASEPSNTFPRAAMLERHSIAMSNAAPSLIALSPGNIHLTVDANKSKKNCHEHSRHAEQEDDDQGSFVG